MKPPVIRRRIMTWIRQVLGGVELHKALERNQKAARDLDAVVREVLRQ
ncbi:MAG: hypothetical protein GY945_05505 [Rhodobacteraceae bacterium]|nr:hypothetical protein [Paracoccaceae bacterium]